MMRTSSPSNTASKLSVNFRSRSRMRKRIGCGRVLSVQVTLPRLLRDPLGIGMGRAFGEMHAATGDLNEEQHVQTAQPDRIDREAINRDPTRRLRAQERAPRGLPPLSSRSELF